jgi:hypothetical protein
MIIFPFVLHCLKIDKIMIKRAQILFFYIFLIFIFTENIINIALHQTQSKL